MMIPHHGMLRVGKEGIARTLQDKLGLVDSRDSRGLWVSDCFVPVLSVDSILDRPRIEHGTVTVAGNGSNTLHTVGEGAQDWLLGYVWSAGTGDFTYNGYIHPTERDESGTDPNFYLFSGKAAADAGERVVLGQPLPLNAGWQLRSSVSAYVSGGPIDVRVILVRRVWRHYDAE